jgi:hypothetical protein
MYELFNPAGLRMLEDRQGAIAFGYVAPRVFYARFVGRLSAELGTTYVEELQLATSELSTLAYFADASALEGYDPLARAAFERFVAVERGKLTSIVILNWLGGSGPASRMFVKSTGEPIKVLTDPLEFERALCNIAPFPDRTAKDWAHVWQVHAPRQIG